MVRALIHCSAWFGTGITHDGFRIEKLSLTALNPPLTTNQIAFSTRALLSRSLP
jgi:hypothetical protein